MTTPLDNARLWWGHNRARVELALPLTVQGRTYTERFPKCMDVWIEADLTPAQAEAYVLRPLRDMKAALNSTKDAKVIDFDQKALNLRNRDSQMTPSQWLDKNGFVDY